METTKHCSKETKKNKKKNRNFQTSDSTCVVVCDTLAAATEGKNNFPGT